MPLTAKELSLLMVAEGTARCGECAYFDQEDDHAQEEAVACGHCRRSTPWRDDPGEPATEQHPHVADEQWCGEFLHRDALIAELKGKKGVNQPLQATPEAIAAIKADPYFPTGRLDIQAD